jgi:hypothetical protein
MFPTAFPFLLGQSNDGHKYGIFRFHTGFQLARLLDPAFIVTHDRVHSVRLFFTSFLMEGNEK